MTEQCKSCISRRNKGVINVKGCLKCSLGLDKYLGEREKCGSYAKGRQKDDYEFEYRNTHIDELNEKWLKGEI